MRQPIVIGRSANARGMHGNVSLVELSQLLQRKKSRCLPPICNTGISSNARVPRMRRERYPSISQTTTVQSAAHFSHDPLQTLAGSNVMVDVGSPGLSMMPATNIRHGRCSVHLLGQASDVAAWPSTEPGPAVLLGNSDPARILDFAWTQHDELHGHRARGIEDLPMSTRFSLWIASSTCNTPGSAEGMPNPFAD